MDALPPIPPSVPDRLRWMRRTVTALSHAARSAHLGSSLSCVEILDALLSTAGITPANAAAMRRDRLIVSKGHAAMGYYAALAAHGLLDPALLDDYLKPGSALWGHVTRTPAVPAIDASTGSLGHGLGLACGYAHGHRLHGWGERVFCLLSDGECDEGSTWEAAAFAGHHRLTALTAVIDCNGIQSLDRCAAVLDKEPFAQRWQAFGWRTAEVDGHDRDALMAVLHPAANGDDRPLAVLARTVKGRGIPRIEDTVASHYHPARAEDLDLFPPCATTSSV